MTFPRQAFLLWAFQGKKELQHKSHRSSSKSNKCLVIKVTATN